MEEKIIPNMRKSTLSVFSIAFCPLADVQNCCDAKGDSTVASAKKFLFNHSDIWVIF